MPAVGSGAVIHAPYLPWRWTVLTGSARALEPPDHAPYSRCCIESVRLALSRENPEGPATSRSRHRAREVARVDPGDYVAGDVAGHIIGRVVAIELRRLVQDVGKCGQLAAALGVDEQTGVPTQSDRLRGPFSAVVAAHRQPSLWGGEGRETSSRPV